MTAPSQPNILIICTDQHRAYDLSCAGSLVAETPSIDRIAARGTRFTRHSTPIAICSPARASLFTGLLPRHHGLAKNGIALDPSLPTLFSILQGNGYRTHASGKLHLQPTHAPKALGLPDTIGFWDEPTEPDWRGPYHGLQSVDLTIGEGVVAAATGHYGWWLRRQGENLAERYTRNQALKAAPPRFSDVWTPSIPSELHYNTWIADRACDFLRDRDRSEPFCLLTSFPDPHHPFAPPEPYASRYDPAQMPAPVRRPGEWDDMPDYYQTIAMSPEDYEEAEAAPSPRIEQAYLVDARDMDDIVARAAAQYFGSIAFLDDCIDRVLDTLAETGADENTIVVFLADHGEMLGNHGYLLKGAPPYLDVLQAPFIIAAPGQPAQVTASLSNHVDLMPTLLDLAGLHEDISDGDGVSLAPILVDGTATARQESFAEFHPRAIPDVYSQTLMTDRWRLSIYPLRSDWGELFNLESDPDELFNLYHDHSHGAVRDVLRETLAAKLPPKPMVDSPSVSPW